MSLAQTTAIEPADAVFDLLDATTSGYTENYGTSYGVTGLWTNTLPTVWHWEERAESERGPGHDQPAEIYTWQPIQTPRDRFSADGDLMVEDPTVEAWVYALDRSDVATYARDTIAILEQYLDDQYQNTDYGSFTVAGIEDFRESKVARRSEHYVYAVEIELERLDTTGP